MWYEGCCGHFAADPVRALSIDRAVYCIPPSRCGPLFQLCKTLFVDGVMDIPVSQQYSRFTTESFHAVFCRTAWVVHFIAP